MAKYSRLMRSGVIEAWVNHRSQHATSRIQTSRRSTGPWRSVGTNSTNGNGRRCTAGRFLISPKRNHMSRKNDSNDQPSSTTAALTTVDNSDPFDVVNLHTLRISQDFASMAGVKMVITTVAVRRPRKYEFVRVRAGSEWRFETGCFINKEPWEVYLVSPQLWPAMLGAVTPTCLALTTTRNSPVPFLWPLVLPDTERPNRWHESARLAEAVWIRSVANMSAGQYEQYSAVENIPEPEWPGDLTMADYLRLAFTNRFVNDTEHPVLKQLRGEI